MGHYFLICVWYWRDDHFASGLTDNQKGGNVHFQKVHFKWKPIAKKGATIRPDAQTLHRCTPWNVGST